MNEDVDLVARDASGGVVDNVTFNPRTVHVQIQVGSQIRTETVPVNPVIVGAPAAGYYITSIDITPSVVSVRGQADALALLKGKANTKAISIAGATGDVSAKVEPGPPQRRDLGHRHDRGGHSSPVAGLDSERERWRGSGRGSRRIASILSRPRA